MSEIKQRTYADVCREAALVYDGIDLVRPDPGIQADAAHLRRLADLLEEIRRHGLPSGLLADVYDLVEPLPADR